MKRSLAGRDVAAVAQRLCVGVQSVGGSVDGTDVVDKNSNMMIDTAVDAVGGIRRYDSQFRQRRGRSGIDRVYFNGGSARRYRIRRRRRV